MAKENNLSDFECDLVVGASLCISETADLLGVSLTIISRVQRAWSENEKMSSEQQFSE